MRWLVLSLMLVCMDPCPALADTRDRAEACAEVKAKIRKLRSKMRQGYTAKQGMRLEEELRELRERRARLCR
ncbi:MAG: hypothetical protein ACREQZ_15270 [Woeseiaceae bacterium]